MSIISAEIVFRRAAVHDDSASNGGGMIATNTAIANAVKNNVWPDVSQAERVAGITKYRKVFIHVANDDDLALIQPRIFIETNTPGDDSVTFFPATLTDVQSSITGSERQYGAGPLNANVSGGATSLNVLTEAVALNCIRNGDLMRVSDKTSVDDVVGHEEYVTVSGVPSYTGDIATVMFTPALANAYLAANTRVAAVYSPATIAGAISSWVETSGSGTYNEATHPVQVDHIGGIHQAWTVTFTSAVNFTVTGSTVGSVGSGNTSSNFAPTNSNFSKPYFTLLAAGFGGTWATGNTITFTTSPAAVAIWEKRIVPAGASSLSGNKVIIGVDGESA